MEDQEIISKVKMILDFMSRSKFAYDEAAKTINFDLAMAAFSAEEREQLSEILKSFSKSTDKNLLDRIPDNLEFYLDVYYRIILDLNNVARYGNVYYNIITRYYIDKEFTNIGAAVKALDGIGSRGTFFRRANEACRQLYLIWSCTGPRYISRVANEFKTL